MTNDTGVMIERISPNPHCSFCNHVAVYRLLPITDAKNVCFVCILCAERLAKKLASSLNNQYGIQV